MTSSTLITSMATDTITIKRPSVGSYNTSGDYIAGPETTITVQGVVYPAQGDDLLKLPEGLRTKETIKILCATEMKSGADDPDSLRKADIITVNGVDYEVSKSMRWKGLGFGSAWEVLAVRLSI